ncbi:hypothetical protein MMC27_000906 [Xylographa pallens]|nr:hypothetical protein [Xylographa pallens]
MCVSYALNPALTAGANDNNTFFVFTAYSITSTILIEGQCSAAQGSPETLSPAFAVAVPSGANITAYAATAESLFINDLGGDPTCLAGVQSAVATPQPIVVFDATGFSTITSPPLSSLVVLTGTPSRTSSPTSAASLTSAIALAGTPSSTSPPTMNDASTDLSTGAKAGLGVAIPLGLIALAVLGTYLWIRRRRTRGTHAELDSEIKVEANGEDVRPEMQGNGGKHELLVQERSQELIGDEAARELTGGEHSHELEAPT